MAFDKTDPAHLLALKTEVSADPIGMGYAAVVDQTTLLLKLLNDPANNVGADTVAQEMTPAVLLDVVDAAEYGGNQVSQGQRDWLKMVFDHGLITGEAIEQFRAKIKAIFPNNGPTNAAIDALQRALSRAEAVPLFGPGTIIGKNDWFAARDS